MELRVVMAWLALSLSLVSWVEHSAEAVRAPTQHQFNRINEPSDHERTRSKAMNTTHQQEHNGKQPNNNKTDQTTTKLATTVRHCELLRHGVSGRPADRSEIQFQWREAARQSFRSQRCGTFRNGERLRRPHPRWREG